MMMDEKEQKVMRKVSLVYYFAFPLATLALCVVSYGLGYQRGQQKEVLQSLVNHPVQTIDIPSEKDLTFYQELRGEEDKDEGAPAVVKSRAETSSKTSVAGKTTESEKKHIQAPAESGLNQFFIQMSAFKDVGKAHEYVDKLRNQGHRAFLGSAEKEDAWHRVYVGPYDERPVAQHVLSQLQDKGFGKGFVVARQP